MKAKQVAYSYPSSPNADRFKFKSGCYTVETIEQDPYRQPPIAVAAFKTQAEAIAYAETMPDPWDDFTMQPYSEPIQPEELIALLRRERKRCRDISTD